MSSLRRLLACALVIVVACRTDRPAPAQLPPQPSITRGEAFDSGEALVKRIKEIVNLPATERAAQAHAMWKQLAAANQVPFAHGEFAAFLYYGPAKSVAVAGDFNDWNPNQKSARAARIEGTDFWYRFDRFPVDARVDYKLVVDDDQWILDPANPLQMWSGFGGMNSELRMPDYKYPLETVRRDDIAHGTLSDDLTLASKPLGYEVSYRVYTPAGYDESQTERLPVVYATDGHEYAADYQGSLTIVLDNLIADRKLRPTIAVFVDPRDPKTGFNRRMAEYGENDAYVAFLADELVPHIDAAYRTRAEPNSRVILGTSLGGLNSAWCGATRADVFGKVAIQSPANFAKYAPHTLDRYAQDPLADKLELVITAGTIGDGDAAPTFAKLLAERGYRRKLLLSNEGHSWGNFRATLDAILTTLIGPPH